MEAELREKRAGPQLREAVRGTQSQMVVQRLRRVLERMRPKTLPKSHLGEAIAFPLEQWPRLEVFLRDGRVEIDNNQIENAIRPTAVGRKAWLFCGSADSGDREAILYIVIESCRQWGVDPFAYLRGLLTPLPKMTNHPVAELLHANWARAQAPALKAAP